MDLLNILYAITVMFSTLIVFVIYPIWTVIHCVVDSKRGALSKILWTIGIIFILPLGAIIYGLISKRKVFKIFSVLSLVFIFIIIIVLFNKGGNASKRLEYNFLKSKSMLSVIDLSDLSDSQILQINQSLYVLNKEQDELEGGLSNVHQRVIFVKLGKEFDQIIRDKKIKSNEYRYWNSLFRSR